MHELANCKSINVFACGLKGRKVLLQLRLRSDHNMWVQYVSQEQYYK
jgi:hypothetical protein